jgi:uncharacterized protein YgiB involved in biofilm formation
LRTHDRTFDGKRLAMMKKKLVLTTAMAATLGACSSANGKNEDVVADRDTAVCVDQDGRRVDDGECKRNTRSGGRIASGFLWYYVGRGSRIPLRGDSVNDPRLDFRGSYFATKGATYAPAPAAANIVRSAAVTRGGFGESARRFGGSWS